MKALKLDIFSFILITIISLLLTLELFIFSGRPASFDALVHIDTFSQFGQAIKSGDFPVIWLNNSANYGLPVGLFTHQFTNYLGASINFLTLNPVLTYNIVLFIAVFLSGIFFYLFLRLHFTPLASLLGIIIFTFTPYHIFNIYVRGALPEIFSGIFLPLILISLHFLIVKKHISAFFFLILSTAGLTLAHPMMLVAYSFLYLPYLIFILWNSTSSKRQKVLLFISSTFGLLLGVFFCSYYILPLIIENKYFYYHFEKNHLVGSFLSLINYFENRWDYFTDSEVFTRGHTAQFGLLETSILLLGLAFYFYQKLIKKGKENLKFLQFILGVSVLIIFFTFPLAEIFYKYIFLLNNLQFPSRFLSVLIFLPPLLAAFFYNMLPKKIILFSLVILVALFSFPQIYGKNFTDYPLSSYYSSKKNVYSINMNPVWSGKSEDYPTRKSQIQIVKGNGKIISENISNSKRTYAIDALSNLNVVDYTFYFPGWNVYVDGVKTKIEFQNPDYRGIITYEVPAGKHKVYLAFEDSVTRFIGKILSLMSILIFFTIFFLRKKIMRVLV